MNSVRDLVNALLKLEEQEPGVLNTKYLCVGKNGEDYTLLSVENTPSELSLKYYFKHIDVRPSVADQTYSLSVYTHFNNTDAEYHRIHSNKGKTTPMYKVINLIDIDNE